MINPFYVRWLQGWSFQLVLMEGKAQVEAYGFGICIRTALLHGETPQDAADRLVLEEDRRRRALHQAWLKGQPTSHHAEVSGSSFVGNNQSHESLVIVHS